MTRVEPKQRSTNPLPEGYEKSRPSRINLRAGSSATKELISLAVNQYCASQLKKVKNENRLLYEKHFEIIILDLLSAWIASPALWIGYSRGKKEFLTGKRYYNPITDTPEVTQTVYTNGIDYLETIGWVENWKASKGYSKISSRFRATNDLVEYFNYYQLNWTSIAFNDEVNVLIVKNDKKEIIPYPKSEFPLDQAIENVNCINANLAQSYLNLDISDEQFNMLQKRLINSVVDDTERNKEPIDFSNRSLKRIFAQSSFNRGGRFYGGW